MVEVSGWRSEREREAPGGGVRKRKESFNTSFGIATYGAVESPGPFIVSFGHVEFAQYVYVGMKKQKTSARRSKVALLWC